MITEDYISFETAKLLKDKGFDINEYEVHYDPFDHTQYEITLQMAMKWLREVHNIFISLHRAISGNGYVYYHEIYNGGIAKYAQYGRTYSTYEEACEVAIKYCLENLILNY